MTPREEFAQLLDNRSSLHETFDILRVAHEAAFDAAIEAQRPKSKRKVKSWRTTFLDSNEGAAVRATFAAEADAIVKHWNEWRDAVKARTRTLCMNPRVLIPFLPHEYEERNGLNYFGNDIKPKVAP